ncbi:MAG: HAMP domain-containing protein [Bacteroidales bacterium]|nr:HAMP domain-containing protein [Bacteroidales bacterium]
MKLSQRLILFFILVSLIPLIAVGVFAFINFKEAMLQRTFDQLTSVRVVKTRQLESFFNDRYTDIEKFARSKEIIHLLELLQTNEYLGHEEELNEFKNAYLYQYFKNSGYYSELLLLTKNTSMAWSNGTNENNLPDTLNKILLSKPIEPGIVDFHHLSDKKIYKRLLFYTPVYNQNNKYLGLCVMTVPLDAINKIMLEKTPESGLGESGESYLVGSDFLMRSTSRFSDESVLSTEVKTEGSIEVLQGKIGTGIFPDYRGIKVLSSYEKLKIKGLDWAILVEMDYSEATIPISRTLNDIIFVSTLLIILIIGLSILISRSITNPITKLKNASILIGQGDFSQKVEKKSNDEIGALTESFNNMADQLQKKTSDLREREERLSHFYEATKDGIMLHKDGVPVLVNQALCELTGYSDSALMLLHMEDIIHCGTKFYEKKEESFEAIAVKSDKSTFPVEIQQSDIDFKGEKISACVIRDISPRKEMEEELRSEREQRLSALFDGQELERKRLSRDLHDGLGQRLIALKLHFESLSNAIPNSLDEQKIMLNSEIDITIDEVRQISGALNPPVLEEFGLDTATKNLCNSFSKNTGLRIYFDADGDLSQINDKQKTYLYRIVQEALNNVAKHAEASDINIQILKKSQSLLLMIEDNGKGFNTEDKHPPGNGLFNMRQRVILLQGKFNIESQAGKGTLISIHIPLKAKS